MNIAERYARLLAAAVRERARARYAASFTGRRWQRPPAGCPTWCTRCTVDRGGEHRSDPITWHTPYGFLVIVLCQTARGRVSVEVRTDVRLPTDQDRARAQASQLAVAIDLTVRAVLDDNTHTIAAPVNTSREVHGNRQRRALPGQNTRGGAA